MSEHTRQVELIGGPCDGEVVEVSMTERECKIAAPQPVSAAWTLLDTRTSFGLYRVFGDPAHFHWKGYTYYESTGGTP